MNPIRIALAHTPEWNAARKTGIGASQAGAACGVSLYGTPLTVYEDITGEPRDLSDNIHVRFGKHVEPAIVSMYEEEFGVKLTYPMPMHRHPDWDFMLATPDAQESDTIGIEIKTLDPFYANILDFDNSSLEDTLPDYVLQAQQQCAVMGWDAVKVSLLIGKKLRVIQVDRDDEMIAMIAEHERALWENHIVPRIAPAPTSHLDLAAFRRRKATVGSVVGLSEDASSKWAEYERLGKEIKSMDERRDLLKAEVLHEIGDAPAGLLTTGDFMIRRKATFRKGYTVQDSEILDVRKIKYDGSPIAQVPSEATEAA